MAPKATFAQLKQLLGKLERDQIGTGRARQGAKGAGNWDCPHCAEGANNFAYRTCCFKCGADRRTGNLQLGVAQQQTGQHANPGQRGQRARSLGQPPATTKNPKATEATAAPASQDGETGDEDAINTELALARSYHEWARKLQGASRDLELPKAVARLGKAEMADKARKPPSERLQSALSRLDHRRRVAEAADGAVEALETKLRAAKEEQAQAQTALREAKQEVETAQQIHAVWGAAGEGTPGAGKRDCSLGAVAGLELSGPQRALIQKTTAELSSECPEVAGLLLRLLNTRVSGLTTQEPAGPLGAASASGDTLATPQPQVAMEQDGHGSGECGADAAERGRKKGPGKKSPRRSRSRRNSPESAIAGHGAVHAGKAAGSEASHAT